MHYLTIIYRPPPAQAQAHPAQAQAQAQLLPPPPPLRKLLEELFGIGLVLLVMPLVKSEIPPTTLLEKSWTPVTIDAAKALPGRFGAEKDGPRLDVAGA